jgi:hypothetical protein
LFVNLGKLPQIAREESAMKTDIKSFFDDENWSSNLLLISKDLERSETGSTKLEDLLLVNELPVDIQERILSLILKENPDGDLIYIFFQKVCTDPALLDRIAKQARPEDSYLIVNNPNTSSMALKHILTDGYREQGVVAEILDHPNCTSEIAMFIASDEDYWGDDEALDALATCTALTNEDVEKILDDWENEIQDYYDLSLHDLLKNPNLHEDTKKRILALSGELERTFEQKAQIVASAFYNRYDEYGEHEILQKVFETHDLSGAIALALVGGDIELASDKSKFWIEDTFNVLNAIFDFPIENEPLSETSGEETVLESESPPNETRDRGTEIHTFDEKIALVANIFRDRLDEFEEAEILQKVFNSHDLAGPIAVGVVDGDIKIKSLNARSWIEDTYKILDQVLYFKVCEQEWSDTSANERSRRRAARMLLQSISKEIPDKIPMEIYQFSDVEIQGWLKFLYYVKRHDSFMADHLVEPSLLEEISSGLDLAEKFNASTFGFLYHVLPDIDKGASAPDVNSELSALASKYTEIFQFHVERSHFRGISLAIAHILLKQRNITLFINAPLVEEFQMEALLSHRDFVNLISENQESLPEQIFTLSPKELVKMIPKMDYNQVDALFEFVDFAFSTNDRDWSAVLESLRSRIPSEN